MAHAPIIVDPSGTTMEEMDKMVSEKCRMLAVLFRPKF